MGMQQINRQQVYSPDVSHLPPPPAWGSYKNYDEANTQFVLVPADMGYVLRIEKVGDPTYSPYVEYDEKGQEKPRARQTLIEFTVVDYANDDPTKSVIGQKITGFFKISMHAKANFYKLAKAAFGGNLDPAWKPNRAELEGRYIGAVISHKDPNDQGQVFAKLETAMPHRGTKDYSDIRPVAAAADDDATPDVQHGSTDGDVPF